MKILIIHNHLRTGGVTSIISSQIRSLQDSGHEISLLVGENASRNLEVLKGIPVFVEPALKYLSAASESPETIKKLYKKVLLCFEKHFSKAHLIHIHNLNLGKNAIVNAAIYEMAKKGTRILNHCHDFAEDLRYDNYCNLRYAIEDVLNYQLQEVLYPAFSTYFYAVLTSRDQKILEQSGINKNNLFLLSNPVEVTTFKDTNQRDESSCSKIRKRLGLKDDLPIMLYPVRAIRRKNIGEILLLSALFSGKAYWIITREPKNPLEKPIYEKWVKYAKREHLSVVFNADEKVDFAELYEAAFKVVVTSVTEGFGLAFLEPWIRGKAVTGRNIPDITSDFKNEGIKLDSLYSVLSIPVSSLSNLSRLETEYSVFLQDIYASYAIEIANGTIKEFLQKKLKEKTIDFADLDILEQQYIISEIKRSPELRETIIKENNLKMILKNPCKKTIEYNKKRIKAVFNLKNYGKKLNKIYLQMLKRESTENAHLQDPAEKLIENFTNAKNIRLIKQ